MLLGEDVSMYVENTQSISAVTEAGLADGFFSAPLSLVIADECEFGDISMLCEVEVSDAANHRALLGVPVYDEAMFFGESLPDGSGQDW